MNSDEARRSNHELLGARVNVKALDFSPVHAREARLKPGDERSPERLWRPKAPAPSADAAKPYDGSANAVNVVADGMTTYCRPSIMKLVGGAKIGAPVEN